MKTEKKLSGLRIKQQVLYVLIFSFVTVTIWIGGSLFRSQKKSGIAPDLLELAKPLNPAINTFILDEIEARPSYTDEELSYFQIYKIIRSKDGREQQVVPIESPLEEIPEIETNLRVLQTQLNALNASPQPSPSPSPTSTTTFTSTASAQQSLDNRPTPSGINPAAFLD